MTEALSFVILVGIGVFVGLGSVVFGYLCISIALRWWEDRK